MLGTRTLGEILADREKIASEMQVNNNDDGHDDDDYGHDDGHDNGADDGDDDSYIK